MQNNKIGPANLLAAALLLCLSVSLIPVFSQTPTVAPPQIKETDTSSAQTAQTTPKLVAPSREECLMRIRSFEPTLQKLKETCKSTISAIIPDPAAYEKTLPPIDKVIADKD